MDLTHEEVAWLQSLSNEQDADHQNAMEAEQHEQEWAINAEAASLFNIIDTTKAERQALVSAAIKRVIDGHTVSFV